MTTTTAPPPAGSTADKPVRQPVTASSPASPGARASLILVVLAGVAAFLIIQAIPRLRGARGRPARTAQSLVAYIGPLVFGTLLAAVIALIIATPLAVGVALFITHYAPRRLAQGSATSSTCSPRSRRSSSASGASPRSRPPSLPFYDWLDEHLGWIPFFAGPVSATGRTMLTVGIVLAVMILPIITAISPRGLPADAARCTRRPRSRSAPPAGR